MIVVARMRFHATSSVVAHACVCMPRQSFSFQLFFNATQCPEPRACPEHFRELWRR